MPTIEETGRQGIDYELKVHDGLALYLPPWEAGNDRWGQLEVPDVYNIGAKQLYPTSTICRKGMRTFVYTKLSSDATVVGAGYCPESTAEYISLTNAVISGVAGSNLVRITRASTAVNQFAGGFLGIKMGTGGMTTVGRYSSRQIIRHTVQDASNIVDFYLDGNNVLALTTGDDCVLCEHPYAEIRTPQTANYHMCIGVYICTVVVSQYLWVQTGGPNNMIAMMATYEGSDPNSVPVYAIAGGAHVSEGGATGSAQQSGIESGSLQIIGYVYASTDIGGPAGTPANVTISPTVFLNIFN